MLCLAHMKCVIMTDRQCGYWSIREPIMSSSHPSRRLLASNGFAWHVYMPYHDACLKGNSTWCWRKWIVVTAPPVLEQSIVMSLSVGLYVCLWAYLRNHMPKLQFSVYIAGALWLIYLLAALDVCEWHHVCPQSARQRWHISSNWLARGQHQTEGGV